VVWNSAKGFNAKKINFVPTIQAIGSEVTIGQYFYKSGYDANRVTVSPISIRRYRRSLQRCFQAAVDAGFTTIHIVPHVDPFQTDGRYIWRNLVAFHPLTKHGPDVPNSFSYFDTLLQPVAQALNAVVRNDTGVWVRDCLCLIGCCTACPPMVSLPPQWLCHSCGRHTSGASDHAPKHAARQHSLDLSSRWCLQHAALLGFTKRQHAARCTTRKAIMACCPFAAKTRVAAQQHTV
jgi:hypothetical protein